MMIKLILHNSYIYQGEVLKETDDYLILRDIKDKIVTIKQNAVAVREELPDDKP